ncbi:hypothetical protein KP509_24G014900 [Ceratopteris richardii]|uniref:Uncharacterized protein n=1 Tax=Ceratopteris richardii TaxID=49495 RepID=A0A8T2RUS0_CERRI|nr:hypothetical protein KP509_24G014900 [Ceratopteris richardii]
MKILVIRLGHSTIRHHIHLSLSLSPLSHHVLASLPALPLMYHSYGAHMWMITTHETKMNAMYADGYAILNINIMLYTSTSGVVSELCVCILNCLREAYVSYSITNR